MPGNEILGPLESRRQQIEQQRENAARLARAYVNTETTGWGEFIKPDVLEFGVTFLAEPTFTSGSILRGDSSGPTGQLVQGRYPRISVGVWRWQHDANGYWTGAYVFFVVETVGFQMTDGFMPAEDDPAYTIAHHMVFEAVAFKDFELGLLDS
jgi:hypothetical protein